MTGVLHGSCHCSAITLTIAHAPETVSECNCSICRRIAGLWGYFDPAEVTVDGDAGGYRWGDRSLTVWHCTHCGCTTHWTAADHHYKRMGVNMRMFAPSVLAGIPVEFTDGARF